LDVASFPSKTHDHEKKKGKEKREEKRREKGQVR
jgi:hypothetical protein